MKTELLDKSGFLWRHLLPLKCPWPPRIVYIEPTNKCNLKCIMCPQATSKVQRGLMEFDLFKKVVSELPKSSHIHLYFRGEALLHPRIGDMVDYIRSRNRNQLTLVTNGSISTNGLTADRLMFSFDAPNKSTYESIRRGANYEVALHHIKQAIHSDNFGKVIATIIEMPQTEQHIRAFARDMYELGVTDVRAKRYLYWDAACKNTNSSSTPCLLPWHTLGIYWDGTATPCCVDYEGRLAIGNAYDNNVMDIWNGSEVVESRRKLKGCKYSCRDALTLMKPQVVVKRDA